MIEYFYLHYSGFFKFHHFNELWIELKLAQITTIIKDIEIFQSSNP